MRTAAMAAPRVLIVDDLDDMRSALRLLLEAEGMDVVGEAENGERGIEVARVLQPDVVVLDGLMPVMNGEEAAHILRRVAPDARIVAFSASFETRPRWADAFVPKDRLTDLFSAIEEVVAAA